MKSPLPTTLAGWIVFYLFLITMLVLGAWILTGKDVPQMTGNVITGVIGGFLGFLTGQGVSYPKDPKVSTNTETTVTTPKDSE